MNKECQKCKDRRVEEYIDWVEKWTDDMDEYALRLKEQYGDDILEKLNTLKHQSKRFKEWELLAIIKYYKLRIKELEQQT